MKDGTVRIMAICTLEELLVVASSCVCVRVAYMRCECSHPVIIIEFNTDWISKFVSSGLASMGYLAPS